MPLNWHNTASKSRQQPRAFKRHALLFHSPKPHLLSASRLRESRARTLSAPMRSSIIPARTLTPSALALHEFDQKTPAHLPVTTAWPRPLHNVGNLDTEHHRRLPFLRR